MNDTPTCGQCGLPLNDGEAVRHYGFSNAHAEYRCHELERMERERLRALNDDLVAALSPFAKCACSEPGKCQCHNCIARDVISKAQVTP